MNASRAISLKLISVTLFVTMSALIKAAMPHVPPGEAVFFRSIFALPVILGWLAMRHELSLGVRTRHPMGHVFRGVLGSFAMGLFFTALGLLPLPEVTALGYTTPLLVVLFAAMFLGERVRAFRLGAVGLGIIGVLIVLSPQLLALQGNSVDARQTLGALVALGGATCAALAQVFVRKLVRTERTATIVFWFSVTSTLMSLLTLPFGWVVPTPQEAILLILAGFLGGAGQIFLTASFRLANVATIAPFDYASMLLALVIGYFVFDEVPTWTMLAGAALVISAGVLIIWREHQLGLARGKARKGMTPQG